MLEYLAKKGYSRTGSMLRKESAAFEDNSNNSHSLSKKPDQGDPQLSFRAYELVLKWIESVLDVYKFELRRLLWPLFVYSFIDLVADFFPVEAAKFFTTFRDRFDKDYIDDLRALSPITLPEHLESNTTAQIYRSHKYRLTLTTAVYSLLVQYLEAKDLEGGSHITQILAAHFNLVTVDRAAAGESRSLARLLSRNAHDADDVPAEDEGIPGHNPGSANTERNAPPVLAKLALAPLPPDADMMEDVKAELEDADAAGPAPAAGRTTLVDEFEAQIKKEPADEAPSRDAIPFPPSLARDVAMEVSRIRENRDRFRIQGRTGGVGPGVSVTMITLHNTFDSLNCIEISGDNALVAVGTSESYIRVWSLDNKPLVSPLDPAGQEPSSSRRLIGHSGPVYALSFSPSIALKDADRAANVSGAPRYLLSCSADSTIRLWSLDTFSNLVVYRSHTSPVWDVRFGPSGHYFVSGGADRTARLWSTSHISPHRLFVGHDSDVDVVAWHPNSAYVFTASGSADRSVRMWDVQRGTAVRLFTGHMGNVTALCASRSGKSLASADDRGELIIWDLASGRLVKRMRGHGRGGVWSLAWSVESTVLVSGGADGTVRVWDVQPASTATDGKVIGEGGAGQKVDAAAATANAASSTAGTTGAGAANSTQTSGTVNVAPGGQQKKSKDVVVSAEQISAFPTKKSPVYTVRFTQMNLVVAGGAYLP